MSVEVWKELAKQSTLALILIYLLFSWGPKFDRMNDQLTELNAALKAHISTIEARPGR